MDRENRIKLLLHLINKLNKGKQKFRSGETSIQKLIYFTMKMKDVPFEYKYTLYNYGPYSFELGEDLRDMENSHIILKEPDPSDFGFRFLPNLEMKYVQDVIKEYTEYDGKMERVIDEFKMKPAKYLALISTFMYVDDTQKPKDDQEQIELVSKIKPMFSKWELEGALNEYKEMLSENI
jgi:uncharacterized protein YwgA